VEGLRDGTIDTIVSDHRPVDQEEKELEFDYASFGSYQLQTVFSVLNSSKTIEINLLLDCLSQKARNILGLTNSPIEIGNRADLTVFDPATSLEFTSDVMISEHAYSPFLNKEMKGKVLAVINGNNASINQ
jgi:dihydroorotase